VIRGQDDHEERKAGVGVRGGGLRKKHTTLEQKLRPPPEMNRQKKQLRQTSITVKAARVTSRGEEWERASPVDPGKTSRLQF